MSAIQCVRDEKATRRGFSGRVGTALASAIVCTILLLNVQAALADSLIPTVPPTLSTSFAPDNVAQNTTTSAEFTITNPNPAATSLRTSGALY